MAALSQVRICNRALSLLGTKRISVLDEDSVNARICNAFYDETLEEILSEHPWTFAQKRAALATVDETPVFTDDLMTVMYQKPADFVNLNFVNIRGAIVKVEGDKILSDTSGLKIKYTYRNTNPQSYFPKFITAFAMLLAANMAYAITNSRTVAADLMNLYETKGLSRVVAADSQQGTPQAPQQSEWIDARISGGGSISGKTGDSTWYPA